MKCGENIEDYEEIQDHLEKVQNGKAFAEGWIKLLHCIGA